MTSKRKLESRLDDLEPSDGEQAFTEAEIEAMSDREKLAYAVENSDPEELADAWRDALTTNDE